jgi:hypothetical protein
MNRKHLFGKNGGSVLHITVFRKFEVCASYEKINNFKAC